MSKLNNTKNYSNKTAPHGLSVSGNGNVQFNKSPEHVLFETVVSTLYGADSAYEKANAKVDRMRDALKEVVNVHGPFGIAYALRVAKFAREQMFIRTMPIVMVVELAKIARDAGLEYDGMRAGAADVIRRADELTDMYAYALTVFGSKKTVPLSLKKGVADAFNKFDAYQFGKYNRADSLKFRDLLRIVHPKPVDKIRAEIFSKLVAETLEPPMTWEVELSANGQLPIKERRSKKDVWTDLVTREGSGSLGYMALLRNLRNMKEAGISDNTWRIVATKLRDPKAVEKSKQLPFGFINAYEIANNNGLPNLILSALTEAAELSLKNIPKLGDRVWIILDSSGSMGASYNSNSVVENSPIKIGAIFSAALYKAAKDSFNVTLTLFDDYAKDVTLNAADSIFSNFEKIMARNSGGSTNLQSALDHKSKLGYEPDVVIILSDMEVNQLDSRTSVGIFHKNCVKVAINLASRGNTPVVDGNGWTQLSGWSERIFQFVKFKRDSTSIVEQLWKGDPVRIDHSEEVAE